MLKNATLLSTTIKNLLCLTRTYKEDRGQFIIAQIQPGILMMYLLPHQKNSIAQQQLSIFPKAAEQYIIGQVTDAAITHLLHTK